MQTIWIGPRTTRFTEVCLACERELPDGNPWATVSGSLELAESTGRVTCRNGHVVPVRRVRRAAARRAAA